MRTSQIRLLCLALSAALCCAPAAARERPETTPAARFLQDNIEKALSLARPPVSAKESGELDIVIRDAMDWPSLTQFAIAHYRNGLDAGGLSDAAARLERQLGLLARRAGKEMPMLSVAFRDLRIDSDGIRRISSIANVPRFGEIRMEWTLRPTAAGYRIADISAMGLTLRQFLRDWVAALVATEGGDPAAVFNDGAATSPQ